VAQPEDDRRCPRCDTPYNEGQEYCLECGERLPARPSLVTRLGVRWRRHLRWYPGDWIWPVLLALVIAALAAAIAILATNDNGSATKTKAGVNEPVPVATGTVGETTTEPNETTPSGSVPTTATTAPEPPPASGQLTEWPAGQSGWTIVLASIPQSGGRAAAVRAAKKATDAGLTDVGILNSSEYSSLHSGYYVIFSGVYSSESEAKAALGTANASYPQAYVRDIAQ
jgi:hypothetical protein